MRVALHYYNLCGLGRGEGSGKEMERVVKQEKAKRCSPKPSEENVSRKD